MGKKLTKKQIRAAEALKRGFTQEQIDESEKIRKAKKKAAKRLAKQIAADREKSDNKELQKAMDAFDAEHNLDISAPEVSNEASDVERIVTDVVKRHFGTDPGVDLSVAMSLLVTTLGRIGDEPELINGIIEVLADIRDGGNGGAYKKGI